MKARSQGPDVRVPERQGLDCCFCLFLALPLTDWGRYLESPLGKISHCLSGSIPFKVTLLILVLPQYSRQCGSLADAREVS